MLALPCVYSSADKLLRVFELLYFFVHFFGLLLSTGRCPICAKTVDEIINFRLAALHLNEIVCSLFCRRLGALKLFHECSEALFLKTELLRNLLIYLLLLFERVSMKSHADKRKRVLGIEMSKVA